MIYMYNFGLKSKGCLISGTSSGLGAFLKKELNPRCIYSRSEKNYFGNISRFDTIIHTACGPPKQSNFDEEEYILNQISLCRSLMSIKHRRFIYVSSIDVNQKQRTLYGEMKYQVEQFIIDNCSRYLIIRPGSLIGEGMRTNTITRIFSEKNPKISLEKNSYYYISFYEDILKLMMTNASGIWTICSHKRIKIDELSRIANNTPKWGSFRYTPLIDDDKSNFYHLNNFSLDCSHKRLKKFFLNYKN